MAVCKQTPQEFIKNAFTPQIGVICSAQAENACQKNNLKFTELVQPFSRLTNDVQYRDFSGEVTTLKNLKLTFWDVQAKPLDVLLGKRMLNASVTAPIFFKNEGIISTNDSRKDTPWFEAWRDTFLTTQYVSSHEYTKHYLSCLIVISSSDSNPMETIQELSQKLTANLFISDEKAPKWFSSNIFKYYVILHDNVEGNIDIANETYESVKTLYGEANCCILKMNSRPIGGANNEHLPDPWSQFINHQIDPKEFVTIQSSSFHKSLEKDEKIMTLTYHPLSPENDETKLIFNDEVKSKSHGGCLTTDDLDQIVKCLHDFCKFCLMPYIEKQIHQLNEVIANKKGVSRSFISATKRWFNKPGAGTATMNNLIYPPDAPELQVRRLGDLYFMFGNYSAAYQAYHLAKRDYNADVAWLYYAGALEMAALSAFMAVESNKKTFEYMEDSISGYLNIKMFDFATRATLLSTECLKSHNMFGEAALQFIRLTSEDSDLRSAIFLEQAAYCFLRSKMARKYAFHMVLAGHRYSKAAQRKHSLRSYKQAFEIYYKSGWKLAEDHIYYTIGRQAHNLQQLGDAVLHISKLLSGTSKQSAQQQGMFLKEYLMILGNKLMKQSDGQMPQLVLPELNVKGLKILLEPTTPLRTPGMIPAVGINFTDNESEESAQEWSKLEETLVQQSHGLLPLTFKPLITLYKLKDFIKSSPIAIVNEPIQVCVQIVNPLQILLQLTDIFLLWSFEHNDTVVDNSKPSENLDSFMKTHITKSALIQTNCTQDIVLSLTPLVTGKIHLTGICYTLSSSNIPEDNIYVQGYQLFDFSTIEKKPEAFSMGLPIEVIASSPCLQVTFSETDSNFLCSELRRVTVEFYNSGTLPLSKILILTSTPKLLCSQHSTDSQGNKHVITIDGVLQPGSTINYPIFLKAQNVASIHEIKLLIYYESAKTGNSLNKYRLIRHKWHLKVHEAFEVNASIQSSYNSYKQAEISIVLNTKNVNTIHTSSPATSIKILNVGMLSKYWTFSQNSTTPRYINLHSQESTSFVLKAKRINETSSKYSSLSFNSDTSQQYLNSACMSLARKSESCQTETPAQLGGFIFVQWQALVHDTQKFVDGQTELYFALDATEEKSELDDVDFASVLEASINSFRTEAERARNQCKITASFEHPFVVEHDFKQKALCVVPVALHLHNITSNEDLSVSVNNTSSPRCDSKSEDVRSVLPGNNFAILGSGNLFVYLQPFSTRSVFVSAVVQNPGTINLASLWQISYTSGNDETAIPVEVQSTLIVINANQ